VTEKVVIVLVLLAVLAVPSCSYLIGLDCYPPRFGFIYGKVCQ